MTRGKRAVPLVYITVGCPGSGKTTWAKGHDPTRWAIISLDDFREMHGGQKKFFDLKLNDNPRIRGLLYGVRQGALELALKLDFNVIMCDMNVARPAQAIWRLFDKLGIVPEIHVFNPSYSVLQSRNTSRPNGSIPEVSLREAYDKINDFKAWWKYHDQNHVHIAQQRDHRRTVTPSPKAEWLDGQTNTGKH